MKCKNCQHINLKKLRYGFYSGDADYCDLYKKYIVDIDKCDFNKKITVYELMLKNGKVNECNNKECGFIGDNRTCRNYYKNKCISLVDALEFKLNNK